MYPVNINASCGHDQARFIEESGDGLHLRNVICGACRTPIVGTHFRCTLCDFRLHPICKTPSLTLSTFLHPQHPLNLSAASPAAPTRCCDVCSEPIRGVYYTYCDFDLHPECSRIPPRVHHVLDLHGHPLELRHAPAFSRRCTVCREDCQGWTYRCVPCDLDVHYRCLFTPADVATPPPSTTRGFRQPFCFGQSNYYNGYGGLPYWLQGNPAGVGFGPGLGIGLGSGLVNMAGSLAVNLLSSLFSNLIQNDFFTV